MSERATTEFREYLIANMMDGEASGVITMRATVLADEVESIVTDWLARAAPLPDTVEHHLSAAMNYLDNEEPGCARTHIVMATVALYRERSAATAVQATLFEKENPPCYSD